jgi:hypothetical protein
MTRPLWHTRTRLTRPAHSRAPQAMYRLAVQRNVLDVTAEDPTDALLLVREKVDCERLMGSSWVTQLVSRCALLLPLHCERHVRLAASCLPRPGRGRGGADAAHCLRRLHRRNCLARRPAARP